MRQRPSLQRSPLRLAIALILIGTLPTLVRSEDAKAPDHLSMTEAVICKTIDGYDQFEARPTAKLTADEKLLIYYRPLHYKVNEKGERSLLHLSQEGRIRRKGEKRVLWKKEVVVDYKVDTTEPLGNVYLSNTIALKSLRPGDYEYEILLRDKQEGSQTATQIVAFEVIPTSSPVASKKGAARSVTEKQDEDP